LLGRAVRLPASSRHPANRLFTGRGEDNKGNSLNVKLGSPKKRR